MPTQREELRARAMKYAPYVIGAVALILAAILLARTLSQYDTGEIVDSFLEIPVANIGMALLFAMLSYFCLTWFDWLGLRYVGRPLPYRRAALASFTALSLGHNIGFSGASSGAIRYRFYSRWGLGLGEVAALVVFCGLTVGLGLLALGSVALLADPSLGEKMTGFSRAGTVAIGIAGLALLGGYLLMSATARRPIKVRRWEIRVPPLPLACGQIVVGTANYLCVAGCLYSVLRQSAGIDYFTVASAYVVGNVASLLAHVPGGVGVVEAVVSYLLPGASVIGGLVMFRVVYYLIPLVLGAISLILSEIKLAAPASPKGGTAGRTRGAAGSANKASTA
jgi:uncharacterized membrane protein YbhN (UPF0104 family)